MPPADAGRIDGIDNRARTLRDGACGIDIRIDNEAARAKTAAGAINSIRDHDDFTAIRVPRPALHQIDDGKIGAAISSRRTERQPQSLSGRGVIRGEVLRDLNRGISHVAYGDRGRRRLRIDEGAQIIKLRAKARIASVVDE